MPQLDFIVCLLCGFESVVSFVHVNLFESDILSECVQSNHFLIAPKCVRNIVASQHILAF